MLYLNSSFMSSLSFSLGAITVGNTIYLPHCELLIRMHLQKKLNKKDEEAFNAFSFTHLIEQINNALSVQSSVANNGSKHKGRIPVHVLRMMNVLDGNDSTELMSVLEANNVMDLIKYHDDSSASPLVGNEVKGANRELPSPPLEDISLFVDFPHPSDEPRFNPEPVYINAAGKERLGITENPKWQWISGQAQAHIDGNNEMQITASLTASANDRTSSQSPSRLSQANFESSKVQKPRWQKASKVCEKRVAELIQRAWETRLEETKSRTPSRASTSCSIGHLWSDTAESYLP